MKATGNQLQQALRSQQERKVFAESRFIASLRVFPGEEDGSPEERMAELQDAEHKISVLQAAQTVFNCRVRVEVLGQGMSLLDAVKRVGAAGRVETLWRDAAKEPLSYERTRVRDHVIQVRTVTRDRCAELAREASRRARAFRAAIQAGNATSIELEMLKDIDLDE